MIVTWKKPWNLKRFLIQNIIIVTVVLLFFLFLHLFPTRASADAMPVEVCDALGGCLGGLDSYNKNGYDGIFDLIQFFVSTATYLSVGIGVLFVVLGGYQLITAQDDEKKYKGGLNTVQYAMTGLTVVILAGTIVGLLIGFLKSDITNTAVASPKPSPTQNQSTTTPTQSKKNSPKALDLDPVQIDSSDD